ncbi:hypothetical protein GQX73_g9074 [Xylaria multiplex]|uniref:Aminoglycoside phosphotransferase domain-containing protein n=1 Tax=Xylaria multiplex TaxID=323545 RepID=A0A7C8IM41_9PEZI|nr:hypothetical protein GQX73_g9074 [Xylaria multiplex]
MNTSDQALKLYEEGLAPPDFDTGTIWPRRDHGELGSDLWTGADDWGTDDKFYIEAHKFFNAVDWQALALIATDCRDGIQCSWVGTDKFSMGQTYMVRRLDFVDGVRWVARLRLPQEATFCSIETEYSRGAFEIEVASMKFFKSKSTIPVPELFAYDRDPSNRVGAAYMLMEYIHGTSAYDLRIANSEPSLFGTPEQDERFRQQMAKIQAQVLAFRFPKIGSLYYDEDTENFFIGPDMVTGKGPWESSADYYRDFTNSLLKDMAARYPGDAEKTSPFYYPVLLNHLMGIYGKNSKGPYSLVNRDFGSHNVLVDNDFNIISVIDFDGVFAAPPEVGAQYPVFTGMHVDLFKAEKSPFTLERIEQTKPKLIKYRELMMKYEAEYTDGNAAVSDLLGSRAAFIYQCIDDCSKSVGTKDEKLRASAIEMLREYAEA